MTPKYTKGMKDSEVYEKMNKIFSMIEPDTPMKNRHCQYISKTDDRHCRMTTLKSCEKCKFFTPTTQSKMRILVEYVLKVEKENRKLKGDKARLDNHIEFLEYRISVLENMK